MRLQAVCYRSLNLPKPNPTKVRQLGGHSTGVQWSSCGCTSPLTIAVYAGVDFTPRRG